MAVVSALVQGSEEAPVADEANEAALGAFGLCWGSAPVPETLGDLWVPELDCETQGERQLGVVARSLSVYPSVREGGV